MSELKAHEAYICHNEFSQDELPQKKDAIVKSASYKEEDDWWDYAVEIECYKKSEADNVIAEKDAKILALDAEVFKQKHHAKLFFDERNYAETQLRHANYKRCLAMAMVCLSEIKKIKESVIITQTYPYMSTCPAECNPKFKYWNRWRTRWLELAEKFKEGK